MEPLLLKKPNTRRRWLTLYRLYRSAFPRAERKPFSVILQKYREGKMDIWCLERAGSFLGLVITINGPSLILVDYLAVAENARGRGVGTAALDAIRTCYKGRDIFLEIESVYDEAPICPSGCAEKPFISETALSP